jgi:NitT/TauT family transport system ATP-binding protein
MAASSDSLLEVSGVSRSFDDAGGPRPVLDRVSFSLAQRDSLSIIGPSGSGKTTLILMIAGLLEPTAGRIAINGDEVRRPRRETGLVLQDYGLFPWKTVRGNIELGARVRKDEVSREALAALEEELGLTGLDHLYPQQLSGGQRQRVALGRAILLRPELLLLDEPFAALDAMTRERLQLALLELFQRRSFGFIVVTHNIEEAVILGRRVLVLGGSPTRVTGIMDNPTFGTPGQRVSERFFAACVTLRTMLEVGQ